MQLVHSSPNLQSCSCWTRRHCQMTNGWPAFPPVALSPCCGPAESEFPNQSGDIDCIVVQTGMVSCGCRSLSSDCATFMGRPVLKKKKTEKVRSIVRKVVVLFDSSQSVDFRPFGLGYSFGLCRSTARTRICCELSILRKFRGSFGDLPDQSLIRLLNDFHQNVGCDFKGLDN
jgi:hypothetical protein